MEISPPVHTIMQNISPCSAISDALITRTNFPAVLNAFRRSYPAISSSLAASDRKSLNTSSAPDGGPCL